MRREEIEMSKIIMYSILLATLLIEYGISDEYMIRPSLAVLIGCITGIVWSWRMQLEEVN